MKTPFENVVENLRLVFPDTPVDELELYVEEFVDGHIENLVEYHDYEEQFSDLIDAGLLPQNKYALLEDEDKEKYLGLWDLKDVKEFIEDVKEFDLALNQPDSRLWSRVKTAFFRRCRT